MVNPHALLISNSTNYGGQFLEHIAPEVVNFLGDRKRVIFVPHAAAARDYDDYVAQVAAVLGPLGIMVEKFERTVIDRLELEQLAIFVGGGNTFRLRSALVERNKFGAIKQMVDWGAYYIGTSAGTNLACPTIKTTNDNPSIAGMSCPLDALGLVPYQIKPHYLDPIPSFPYMGETHEERIQEFHEGNDIPVVGLREGSWIRVEDGKSVLRGPKSARLFRKGLDPIEIEPGVVIEEFL